MMTDLTKQWEKGELESGWYFVKVGNYEAEIDLYDDGQNQWFNCCDKDIYPVKVLAPVPTYQEYLESEAHCAVYSEENKRFKEENAKLKELLKECGRQLQEVELCRYDVSDVDQEDWFRISTEQAEIANKMKTKIDEVLK